MDWWKSPNSGLLQIKEVTSEPFQIFESERWLWTLQHKLLFKQTKNTSIHIEIWDPMLYTPSYIRKRFIKAQAPYFSKYSLSTWFHFRSSSQHTLGFIRLQSRTQGNTSRTLHFI